MKKRVISLALIFAILLSCTAVSTNAFASSGETYYIDSISGDDSNTGTSENNAWKTIEKASSMTYSAGDKILFKAGGIYAGTFKAKGNGTNENMITISSYGDTEIDGLPLLYTNEDKAVIMLQNVSGWCVENLEITAPNGCGIFLLADGNSGFIKDFVIRDCVIHDVCLKPLVRSRDYSAFRISSIGADNRIENLSISDLNIYDCNYGITMNGTTIEYTRSDYISPEYSYNQNFVIEDVTMNNILYDAIVITAMNNLLIRNCALINTALRDDWPTAAMWSHHAQNMLIENCEIAGSTNIKDGMAVDFDGWTTDSMYQYVYSHDNVCFMKNFLYDEITENANCTVRYCLSVNDNKLTNKFCDFMANAHLPKDSQSRMQNFKFYNNTIVNGCEFDMRDVEGAYVANNIFCGDYSMEFVTKHISRDKEAGTEKITEFKGTFTNNCFYGCAIPIKSENSIAADPQFIGTDYSDINSFKLSENSPLLGKGVQVEEDMGEHDFYGNPLTDTHNIGCYEGVGEETENTKSLFSYIPDFVKIIAGYILGLYVDFREYYL